MTWTHETEALAKRLRDNPNADPADPIPHEMVMRMVRERLEAAAEIERLQKENDSLKEQMAASRVGRVPPNATKIT